MDFQDYHILIAQNFKALAKMNRRIVEGRPEGDFNLVYEQITQQSRAAFLETHYPTFMVLSSIINFYQDEVSPFGFTKNLKKTKLSIEIERKSLELNMTHYSDEDPKTLSLFGGAVSFYNIGATGGDAGDQFIHYFQLELSGIKNWSATDFGILIAELNQILPPRG